MRISGMHIQSRLGAYRLEYSHLNAIESFFEIEDIIMVDSKVRSLYPERFEKSGLSRSIILIEAEEQNKTVEYAMQLVDQVLERGVTKRSRIVSFGGGIVQDLSGFVASIVYRGLRWCYFPTTLLAQTDSCIGAKTSINYGKNKNLIGTFYNPEIVYIVPDFLRTLERREVLSGLGELVKLHIIGGEGSIDRLAGARDALLHSEETALTEMTRSALEIKKTYIEEDETDKGVRNILNYGHCIGHAIETMTNYLVPHGQAVTLGMILANRLAEKKGCLEKSKRSFIELELLLPFIAEEFLSIRLDEEAIIAAMKKDKKRSTSNLVVIYPLSDGSMRKDPNIAENEIATLLNEWNGQIDGARQ